MIVQSNSDGNQEANPGPQKNLVGIQVQRGLNAKGPLWKQEEDYSARESSANGRTGCESFAKDAREILQLLKSDSTPFCLHLAKKEVVLVSYSEVFI